MALIRSGSSAQRFFDRIAPWYDRINARIYKPAWLERVRSEIRGARVLDVGVGTGFTTAHLDGAIGIDLSAEMLRRAQYSGQLIRGDLMRPPFRHGRFDTIVFAGSFYYLSSPDQGARIATDLVRSGGRVVLLSPATRLLSPFVKVYDRRDYREILKRAGLRRVRYERLDRAACLVIAEKP